MTIPTPEEDRSEPPGMYAPATGAPTYDLVTTETGYCCMEKVVDGDWVHADDYRTLTHERDIARAEVERLRAERDALADVIAEFIIAQHCRLCGAVWSHAWAEHHGTGCLAAATTTKGETP